MGGFHDIGQEGFDRVVDADHVHLAARHHHVAHGQLGDFQHAFDHGQRLGVEEIALEGGVQQRDQFLPVLGFAQQQGRQAFKPGRFMTGIVRFHSRRSMLHGVGVCVS